MGPSATHLLKSAFIFSGSVTRLGVGEGKRYTTAAHQYRCLSVRCSLEVGLGDQKVQKRLLSPCFQRSLHPRRSPLAFSQLTVGIHMISFPAYPIASPKLFPPSPYPTPPPPAKETLSYIGFDLSLQRYQIVFTGPLCSTKALFLSEAVSFFS